MARKHQYRVRFHLGQGENFMKWQVKDMSSGEVKYYDPDTTMLIMYNCVLRNQRKTAQRILEGENKTVCAWVNAENVLTSPRLSVEPDSEVWCKVMFNPRNKPHWHDPSGRDIDNHNTHKVVSLGRNLYSTSLY